MRTTEVDEHTCLLSVEDFKSAVSNGEFTDYDGYGVPSDGTMEDNTVIILPSSLSIPSWCSHINWFNK